MKNYKIGLRVWIKEETNGHFLGNGRVQLLENIKNTGSITKGAALMNMSYRQAWQMVEEINAASNTPLVEKMLGGKGGGGAKLTEAGESAVQKFHVIEKKIAEFATLLNQELQF